MGGPGSGKKPKVYPADLVARVRTLYEAGHTQEEIAAELRLGRKVVYRLMINHEIPRRPSAKRNQAGAANNSWKGDAATYAAFHWRVVARHGKPSLCVKCGATEGRFEWANLTGDYANVADYERLCTFCHRRLDADRRRETGRSTSPFGRNIRIGLGYELRPTEEAT
jgi:hypothetical protein